MAPRGCACAAVVLLACTLSSARSLPKPRALADRTAALDSPLRLGGFLGPTHQLPSAANCTWQTFEQPLDHFSTGATPGSGATYSQRVCVVDTFWKQPAAGGAAHASEFGPIFFYSGNESPLEEYINSGGLMWEQAPKFGALLVWAEHRYEGKSVPNTINQPNCMAYATSEQALADYAALLTNLRFKALSGALAASLHGKPAPPMDVRPEAAKGWIPAITFGGSYGGMLSSWFRTKYPHIVDGAIAASAPILGMPVADPPLDGSFVAVTRALGQQGGVPGGDRCATNLRAAWVLISALAKLESQQQGVLGELSKRFSLCEATPFKTADQLPAFLAWGQQVFFNLAEGDYPFSSTYISSAVGNNTEPLPAWPMHKACESLGKDLGVTLEGDEAAVKYTLKVGGLEMKVDWDKVDLGAVPAKLVDQQNSDVWRLVEGARDAVAVWFNVTKKEKCYSFSNASSEAAPVESMAADSQVCGTKQWAAGTWGPLCCNDNLNLVNYLQQGVGRDAYWPPSVPRGNVGNLTASLGPRGTKSPGCPTTGGFTGYPKYADKWSQQMADEYGGRRSIDTASNIVYSNGLLDPWSAAGVYVDGVPPPGVFHGRKVQVISSERSLIAVIIPEGGHHVDLFFNSDNDPQSIRDARALESEYMAKWIAAASTPHPSSSGVEIVI